MTLASHIYEKMGVIMKKKYLVPFFVLIFTFLFPVTAYAGGINGAEQGIISAISATYEYNGAYYKVTDGYISQVTAYLSQDGVDLSDDEASGYVSQFYANIATGISSGYMVKVGDAGGTTPTNPQETEVQETTEETETETETQTEAQETEEKTSKKDSEIENESVAESEEESSQEIEIVDNTIGSTQSGKIDYTVTPMDAVMYVWDIDSLDVHTEAYKDSDIIGTLYRGDRVIVTGAATTGWAEIDYNGETGYVSAAYLRTEGYMKNIGIEIETEESEEQITEENATEENTTEESVTEESGKDYSNAAPFTKAVKIEVIAAGVVVILLIVSVVIVLLHKNKSKK